MLGQVGVGVPPAQVPWGWAAAQGHSRGGGQGSLVRWHSRDRVLVALGVLRQSLVSTEHPEAAEEELPPPPGRFSLYFRAIYMSSDQNPA